MHNRGAMGAQNAHASTNKGSRFGIFSSRPAILAVQPDAWDRYGEHATRCFEFASAGQGRQQSCKRGSCGRADDLSKR